MVSGDGDIQRHYVKTHYDCSYHICSSQFQHVWWVFWTHYSVWRAAQLVLGWSSAGVVGLVLALAGADVTLTDLPHVTWLARENVAANCDSPLIRAQVPTSCMQS